MTKTNPYLYVGDHDDALACGVRLSPGQPPVDASLVDPGDPHDQRMLEEGTLIETAPEDVSEEEALSRRATELGIEDPASLSPAALRKAVAKAEREALERRATELGVEDAGSMRPAALRAAVAKAEQDPVNANQEG